MAESQEGCTELRRGGSEAPEAGVCAESVEFSGLRLLVSPVHDALTPKNVGQDEIHKDPTPRVSPQHAFSRSSPPCTVAFTGSYVSPNSVLWKLVYGTEFRSGPASFQKALGEPNAPGWACNNSGRMQRVQGRTWRPRRTQQSAPTRNQSDTRILRISPEQAISHSLLLL